MGDVLDKLQEVIRKSLPEQVGGELKEYLKKAERNQELVDGLTRELNDANERLLELDGAVSRLSASLTKAGDLEKKEQDIRRRENCHETWVANAHAKAAENKADAIERLVEKVFTYRRHVVVNETSSVPLSDGTGYVQLHTGTNSKEVKEGEGA